MAYTDADEQIFRRKIFVGGLTANTTQAHLERYFVRFGKVERTSIILDRDTGRSRCFGFVTMSSARACRAILGRKHEVNGKTVECKPAVPKRGNMQSKRARKIFVGGLLPSISQEQFNSYFAQFGEIEDSVVMRDRVTGKPRGFGFVTFVNEEDVDRVLLNYQNNYLRNKWIEVKRATPKEELRDSWQESDKTEDVSNENLFQSRTSIDTEDLCRNLCECILSDD